MVYSGHCLVAENGILLGESERFSFETRQIVADVDVQHLAHDRLKSSSFRDEASTMPMHRITFDLGPALGGDDKLLRTISAFSEPAT